MLSIDTNILVYVLNRASREHAAAKAFLSRIATTADVVICELVLLEAYVLLRNPAVFPTPCSAPEAVQRIQAFRQHPRWRVVDYPGGAARIMDALWTEASRPNLGRRRVFDVRLALTLRHHNVTELATANVSHFNGFGFTRVWDPVEKLAF